MFVDFIVQNRFYLVAVVFFLALVAWVYRPDARKRFEADGNIPFDGNDDALPRRVDRP